MAEQTPSTQQVTEPSIAELLSKDEETWQELPADLAKQTVKQMTKGYSKYIPVDEPARPEDLAMLVPKGFEINLTPAGKGGHSAIWHCTFSDPTGKIVKKLALKRIIVSDAKKWKWTIDEFEKQIMIEIRLNELVIQNPSENVARHELVWSIKEETLRYPNPISYLIFIERCDGSMMDFSTDENWGFGFTIPDPNATAKDIGNPTYKSLPEFVNKIWLKHTCQGLDFLHSHQKIVKGESKQLAIIHHDLKQGNVLFQIHPENQNKIKFMLTDFGASEVIPIPDDGSSVMSSQVGTGRINRFMPPEVKTIIAQLQRTKKDLNDAAKEGFTFDAKKKEVYPLAVMLSDSLTGFTDLRTAGATNAIANYWKEKRLDKGKKDEYKQQFGVSDEMIELMFGLASKDPTQRPSVQQVLQHRWLQDQRLQGEFVDYRRNEEGASSSGLSKRGK